MAGRAMIRAAREAPPEHVPLVPLPDHHQPGRPKATTRFGGGRASFATQAAVPTESRRLGRLQRWYTSCT